MSGGGGGDDDNGHSRQQASKDSKSLKSTCFKESLESEEPKCGQNPINQSSLIQFVRSLALKIQKNSIAQAVCFLILAYFVSLRWSANNSVSSQETGEDRKFVWISLNEGDSVKTIEMKLQSIESDTEYIGALLNLGSTPVIRNIAMATEHLASVMAQKSIKGACIVTHGASGYFAAPHATVDSIVESLSSTGHLPFYFYSLHGFGNVGTMALKESMVRCFSGKSNNFEKCPRVLENSKDCPKNVNSQIRRNSMITLNTLQRKLDRVEIPYFKESVASTKLMHRASSKKSLLKTACIFFTRIIGFVYPFDETYASLKNEEHKLREWRSYWTIYGFVHVMEDILFIHLIYLMPVYLLAKMIFMGWCIIPRPDNAVQTYNHFVHTVQSLFEPEEQITDKQ